MLGQKNNLSFSFKFESITTIYCKNVVDVEFLIIKTNSHNVIHSFSSIQNIKIFSRIFSQFSRSVSHLFSRNLHQYLCL